MLNAAWDVNIPVASENALPSYDKAGYNKILENAKPWNDPDGRHLSVFTYLRLSPILMEYHNFIEFERFLKRMHGKTLPSMPSICSSYKNLTLPQCSNELRLIIVVMQGNPCAIRNCIRVRI